MRRKDGRELFQAFLGDNREVTEEQETMVEQITTPSREKSLYSVVKHLLSLGETAWYLYA